VGAVVTRRLRYTLIVVLMVGLLSPVISVFVAQKSAARAVHDSQKANAAAAEQYRQATCGLFSALMDVFKETPPTNDTGKNVQRAWAEQYALYRCQPPRNE
jgi:hypothetical protein